MNINKKIPTAIIQFAKIYIIVISFFTLFRVILFTTEISRIDNSIAIIDIFHSFLLGLRFDLVIAGYVIILPYIILTVFSFFKREYKIVKIIVFYYIVILFPLAFLVSAADIPYFNQFFARFSISAFEWLDNPVFVFKMIIQESRYWLVIIPYIIAVYFFVKLTKNIFSLSYENSNENIYAKIFLSVFCLGFIFLGIRGRIEQKSPIKIGTAYFSNNAFLNQLGLNPNFTLIRSYLDSQKDENKSIRLIDDSLAIANVQKYLNITVPDNNFPLRRMISFDSIIAVKHNVVIIIMESMSAAKMKRHGNKNNLTPFLDSISNEGYYFENAYTAGIHTFNGIFSTLFSYPAIFRQHPMKESSMLKFSGIFSTLKNNGYSTIFFTTHDGQFDNTEGFLKANDCEKVISKSDYPSDKIKTILGVPDDYMFGFSIPVLNELNAKNKPFFAAFMTASNHGPYYIPDYFNPLNKDIKNQIVEYADFSLRKFIDLTSKQKWFKNTIFVFVADHGSPIDATYDMSMDYYHTPLIFYAPDIIKERKTFDCIAGQIDVFPSIMGLLKIPYENNTLGINLFEEKRPFIIYNADDKYGVTDDEWFLIVRNDKSKGLYKYRNKDKINYANERTDIADVMDEYAKSNLQAFQYLIHLTQRKQKN